MDQLSIFINNQVLNYSDDDIRSDPTCNISRERHGIINKVPFNMYCRERRVMQELKAIYDGEVFVD